MYIMLFPFIAKAIKLFRLHLLVAISVILSYKSVINKLMVHKIKSMYRKLLLGKAIMLVVILGFYSVEVKADHLMGSELGWESLGGDSFKITLVIYQDCNGCHFERRPTGCTSDLCGAPPLTLESTCGKKTVSFKHISYEEVTPVCKGQCSRCNDCNCSFAFGIRKHILATIVEFSDWRKSGCCSINISLASCCRSASITTGASWDAYYIDAQMNICLKTPDNSPQFTYPPSLLICQFQDYKYNLGATDTDIDSMSGLFSDSLVHSFSQPMATSTRATKWTGSYDYDKPIFFLGFPNTTLKLPKGLHLDEANGELSFRPMKTEVTIVSIKVDEYRNGKLIGFVKRDLQLMIMKCPNNSAPVISGVDCDNATNVEITGCVGDEITFSVCTDDNDSDDSLSLAVNKLPAGAHFKVDNGTALHPTGYVSWVLDSTAIFNSPHRFVFTVEDDNCPLKALSFRSILVFIKNKNPAKARIQHKLIDTTCARYWLSIQVLDTLATDEIYWMVNDTLVGQADSFDFCPMTADTQFVKAIIKRGGCFYPFYDTILPKFFKPIHISPFHLLANCAGLPIIDTIKASGGDGKFTYKWVYQRPLGNIDIIGADRNVYLIPEFFEQGSRLKLEVTDGKGCTAVRWEDIHVKPSNKRQMLPDTSLCTSDTFSIKLPVKNGQWYHDYQKIYKRFYSKDFSPGLHHLYYLEEDTTKCWVGATDVAFTPNPKLKVPSMIKICLNHAEVPLTSNYPNTKWKGQNIVHDSFYHDRFATKGQVKLMAIANSVAGCKDTAYTIVDVGGDTASVYIRNHWSLCINGNDTAIWIGNALSGGWSGAGSIIYESSGKFFIDVSNLSIGNNKIYYNGITTRYCNVSKEVNIEGKTPGNISFSVPNNPLCVGIDTIKLKSNPVAKWHGAGVEANGSDYIFTTHDLYAGKYTVYAKYKSNSCYAVDSVMLTVLDTIAGSHPPVVQECSGDTFTLRFHPDKLGYWVGFNPTTNVKTSSQKISYSKNDSSNHRFTYRLYPQYANSYCNIISDLTVKLVPYHVPHLPDTFVYCNVDSLIRLKGHLPNTIWKGDGVLNSGNDYFFNAAKSSSNSGKLHMIRYNDGLCPSLNGPNFRLQKLPDANAGDDTLICLRASLKYYYFSNSKAKWSGPFLYGSNGVAYTQNTPSGTYTYISTATNKYGCTNSDTMQITLGKQPSIQFDADVKSGEAPLTVSFSSTLGNARYFVWYFGTGDSSLNVAKPQYTYSTAGSYTVQLSAVDSTGSCVERKVKEDFIEVTKKNGISTIVGHGLRIYPNPSVSEFIIENKENETLDISIYNVQGKLLEQYRTSTNSSFGAHYPKGVYLIHLSTEQGTLLVQRVVKE